MTNERTPSVHQNPHDEQWRRRRRSEAVRTSAALTPRETLGMRGTVRDTVRNCEISPQSVCDCAL